MNILITTFFIECKEHISSGFRNFYYSLRLDNISPEKMDVRLLACEELYNDNKESNIIEISKTFLFDRNDVINIFEEDNLNHEKLREKIYSLGLSNEQKTRLSSLIKTKIGNWQPDLILTTGFNPMTTIMESIYPNALNLIEENAIFSRPPFPATMSFDPFGSVPENFLTKFSDEINKFKITDEQNEKLNVFKKFLTNLIDKYSPLDDEIFFFYRHKFEKFVLLPLVGNIFISRFKDCICNSEFELVEYVLQNVPKEIGVFVTQGDFNASLTSEDIEFFSKKYANFIFLKSTDNRTFCSNSLHYFKYIDGVINITSKTAFLALLWDKPVISLSRTYNNWFKDLQDIKEIKKAINSPVRNKNNILFWYFTRYVVFSLDGSQKNYIFEYFSELINKYRREGITFGFYNEINNIDKIFDYTIQSVIQYYQKQANAQKIQLEIQGEQLNTQNAQLNSQSEQLRQITEEINFLLLKYNRIKNSKLWRFAKKLNRITTSIRRIFK